MTVINQSYTDGPDTVRADTDDNYYLELLGGNDRVTHTGLGSSEFNLGDGSDVVYLYGSNGLARGGLGNDFAYVIGLSNRFEGGDGEDYLNLRGGRYHQAWGGDGNDRFYVTQQTFNVRLSGDAGDDRFYGNDVLSSGVIHGGDGNDSFYGFGSQIGPNDALRQWTLYGGAGDDFYQLSLAGSVRIYERGHEGTDTVEVALGQSYTLGSSIENLQVGSLDTGLDGATLTGNKLANVITGSARSETLVGLGGNDSLTGGAGVDQLIGGEGNDTYYVNGDTDTITELAGGGFDTVHFSGGSFAVGDEVEQIYVSGDVSGTITANDSANYIYSDNGDRTIVALGGRDIIFAGTGDNIIDAGSGDDNVSAGGGNNLIHGGSGNDFLGTSGGSDIIYGDDGNDNIYSYGGDDYLIGGAGDDQLRGGAGADTLDGGEGDDYYVLDSDPDTVIELDGQGNDTIEIGSYFSGSYTLPDFVETLLFSGYNSIDALTGNDLNNYIGPRDLGAYSGDIFGLGGNDVLRSGEGDDLVDGGTGDDEIIRGYGHDEITGGAGDDWIHLWGSFDGGALIHGDPGNDIIDAWTDDRIVYTSSTDTGAADGIDTIRLFADGATIDLSAVDANMTLAGQQHLVLVGNKATPGIGELYELHDSSGNLTGYAANLDGDADVELSFAIGSFDYYNSDAPLPMFQYDIVV